MLLNGIIDKIKLSKKEAKIRAGRLTGYLSKDKFNKRRTGISAVEYAFLISVVIAALLAMSVYLRRSISGKWRRGVDDAFGHGRQYDPLLTEFY